MMVWHFDRLFASVTDGQKNTDEQTQTLIDSINMYRAKRVHGRASRGKNKKIVEQLTSVLIAQTKTKPK